MNSNFSTYPQLRTYKNGPAPHDAGPTKKRDDKHARNLERRINDWEKLSSKNGFHKPGSLKKAS